MPTLDIGSGCAVLFDETDRLLIEGWNWYAHVTKHTTYVRGYPRGRRWEGLRYMHRVLMNVTDRRQEVDHQNDDGLDNRRSNLRVCDRGLNNANRQRFRGKKTSRFKGVSWSRRVQRWCAEVSYQGHRYSLGHFATEQEAADAYAKRARELFGEFAYLGELTSISSK